MSRIALLADIHGNLPALEAVLRDLESWRPHAVIVVGDAICWGPQSRAVLELLQAVGAICLRGNNEYYLLDWRTPRMPEAWLHYELLPPLYEDLGETWRTRIGLWPDELTLRLPEAPPVHLCHGLPDNPWQGIFAGEQPDLGAVAADCYVTAHTHLPMSVEFEGKRVINPGSVGVPLDGDRRAQYATLEAQGGDWTITHHRATYDYAFLERAWQDTSFERRNGSMSKLVMREFETAEIQVIPFLAFRRAEGLSEEEAFDRFTGEVRLRYTPEPYRLALRSASA